MTAKELLAGIGATILYKLQMLTGGKIGGFTLYHHLWKAYTANYTKQRTGYLVKDRQSERA